MATQTPSTTLTPRRLGGRWIDDWRPEDLDFWNAKGRAIAGRNLLYWCSPSTSASPSGACGPSSCCSSAPSTGSTRRASSS